MLSPTLQMLTLLAVKAIADVPAVLGQAPAGLPNLSGLPIPAGLNQCVITCMMSGYAAVSQTCPSMTDIACFCKNADFIRTNQACLVSTCPPSVLPNIAAFATKTCTAAGVTLPESATAPPPAATTTAAPTSPAASPAPTVSAAPTTVPAVQDILNSTADNLSASIPAAVSVNATSLAPISGTTNVVSNSSASIVANTSTVVKPAASDVKNPPKASQTLSAAPKVNATNESTQTDQSSGSSIKATGVYMMLTVLAAFIVL